MGAEEQKNRHEEEEAEKKGDKNTTTNELGAFAQLLRRCSTTLRSMRREFPPNTNVVGSLFLSKKTKDARARVAGLTREMEDETSELWALSRQTREEEKESEYLHFEKKTRILREITDVSREILTNAEVYQGGRRGVAVNALECAFLILNFVEIQRC